MKAIDPTERNCPSLGSWPSWSIIAFPDLDLMLYQVETLPQAGGSVPSYSNAAQQQFSVHNTIHSFMCSTIGFSSCLSFLPSYYSRVASCIFWPCFISTLFPSPSLHEINSCWKILPSLGRCMYPYAYVENVFSTWCSIQAKEEQCPGGGTWLKLRCAKLLLYHIFQAKPWV